MRTMKTTMGLAVLAGAATFASAGAANAEVTANVALTTDYVYRGVSLSGEDPTVQGGFDWGQDNIYAGVWGSGLGSAGSSMELDLYVGFTPQLGPVTLDLSVMGVFYPGADDDGFESDYYEFKAGGEVEPTSQLTFGVAIHFSPEYAGEVGNTLTYEGTAEYAFSDAFRFSGTLGNQSLEDVDGPGGGADVEDDYTYWSLGATYAIHGFQLDLRWHEADISAGDPIDLAGYATQATAEGRAVLTVSREL